MDLWGGCEGVPVRGHARILTSSTWYLAIPVPTLRRWETFNAE